MIKIGKIALFDSPNTVFVDIETGLSIDYKDVKQNWIAYDLHALLSKHGDPVMFNGLSPAEKEILSPYYYGGSDSYISSRWKEFVFGKFPSCFYEYTGIFPSHNRFYPEKVKWEPRDFTFNVVNLKGEVEEVVFNNCTYLANFTGHDSWGNPVEHYNKSGNPPENYIATEVIGAQNNDWGNSMVLFHPTRKFRSLSNLDGFLLEEVPLQEVPLQINNKKMKLCDCVVGYSHTGRTKWKEYIWQGKDCYDTSLEFVCQGCGKMFSLQEFAVNLKKGWGATKFSWVEVAK